MTGLTDIEAVLGDASKGLLHHTCEAVPVTSIHSPGPDFLERVKVKSERNPRVLAALQRLFASGRLANTGYLSLLPVDHGIAHTAGMVFAANPAYLDPVAIVQLAREGGCSGLVTTYGALGAVSRVAAHRLPIVLKLNHDEQFAWPPRFENILFARVEEAEAMGCVGVAATVYFGGPTARSELVAISELFGLAHELGLATILFCYLHPRALNAAGKEMIFAADLTAEANHQGVTIGADLIKQKQPHWTGGYELLGPGYGKTDERMYTELGTSHPIDLTRYQLLLGYCGRAGLIHSGGATGDNDIQAAVRSAVINKRGGGMGLLAGRKAFQVPMARGVELLHAIQDVYLNESITLA